MTVSQAFLGGGCFWCLEAVFQRLKGVQKVTSGYMGGQTLSPSYEEVCGKETGHAEVVRIDFDATEITMAQLLDVFFDIHDPTTPDRQGNDVGPQYRSIIFPVGDRQHDTAKAAISALREASRYVEPILTEIVPVTELQWRGETQEVDKTFWPAEPYHQNYFNDQPRQAYCRLVVAPKLNKAQLAFASLMRSLPGK